jgi:uncharacterized protein (UPF0276 family)
MAAKKELPYLGVGLGLRREIAEQSIQAASTQPKKIEWLEFVPENYLNIGGAAQERLEEALQHCPLVSHGVNLSIGSTDDLNLDYIKGLKELLDAVDSPWWSDHLCFTSIEKTYLHDLLPLPFSREAVEHVVKRIKAVQKLIDRPFLIENISFYMNMPGAELTEAQFMSEILEKADCGLLLDVNNVYVNSLNHEFDAKEFMDQLPLERTVQIHIAGHADSDECVIDTHGAPIVEPVYELLSYVLPRTGAKAILLERDQELDDFPALIDELDRIRSIAAAASPAREVVVNHNTHQRHVTSLKA